MVDQKKKGRFALIERDPEWLRTVEQVKRCQSSGFDADQIASVTGVDALEVRRIIQDDEITRAAARENYLARFDVVKDIMGLGLDCILRVIKEIHENDETRKIMLPNMRSLKGLTDVIAQLNTIVRLNEGMSTANVSTISENHVITETRVVLEELKKRDPVFGETYVEVTEEVTQELPPPE